MVLGVGSGGRRGGGGLSVSGERVPYEKKQNTWNSQFTGQGSRSTLNRVISQSRPLY